MADMYFQGRQTSVIQILLKKLVKILSFNHLICKIIHLTIHGLIGNHMMMAPYLVQYNGIKKQTKKE